MPNTAVRAAGEAMPASKRIQFNLHPDELPEICALICEGDCMLPDIASGAKLVFSRTQLYKSGDLVALWKRPDLLKPTEHQVIVKRLVLPPSDFAKLGVERHPDSNVDPLVVVEMSNPRKQFAYSVSHLQAIHRCLGPVPKGVETYPVDDAEARAIGRRRTERCWNPSPR